MEAREALGDADTPDAIEASLERPCEAEAGILERLSVRSRDDRPPSEGAPAPALRATNSPSKRCATTHVLTALRDERAATNAPMALLQISRAGRDRPIRSGERRARRRHRPRHHQLPGRLLPRDGVADGLRDEDGHALLPSVVRYPRRRRACWSATPPAHARDRSARHDRELGQALDGPRRRRHRDAWQARCPTRSRPRPGMVQLQHRAGATLTPVEVSAEILRALKPARRGRRSATPVDRAVITVPAYFDDAQRAGDQGRGAARRARRAAPAQRADRGGARLRPRQRPKGIYAVYDLGGGTFDISMLRLDEGRVPGARDRRRHGARRRRLRPCASPSACCAERSEPACSTNAEQARVLDGARAVEGALTDATTVDGRIELDGRPSDRTARRAPSSSR